MRGHEVGGASTSRSSAVQLDNARGVAKKMRVGAGGRATRTRDHDDDDRVSDECLLKYEGCHGFRVSGRKSCMECAKALDSARAMIAQLESKLPPRKLPAAPPSLPQTPEKASTTNRFISNHSRDEIERWIANSAASITPRSVFSPIAAATLSAATASPAGDSLATTTPATFRRPFISPASRESMRAAGRPGISPTSAVWGDDPRDGVADRGAPMQQRHLGA